MKNSDCTRNSFPYFSKFSNRGLKTLPACLLITTLAFALPAQSSQAPNPQQTKIPTSSAQKLSRETIKADYHPLVRVLPTSFLRYLSLKFDRRKIHCARTWSEKTSEDRHSCSTPSSILTTQNRRSGNTLLHRCLAQAHAFAVKKNGSIDWSNCELLLQLGADPLIRNKAGLSALELAQKLSLLDQMPQSLRDRLENRVSSYRFRFQIKTPSLNLSR